MPAGLAAGCGWSLGITLCSAAVAAKMMETEYLKENTIGYIAIGILLLSAFSGALIACGLIKHRKLLISTLSGLVYYVVLLSMTALFFGGQYQGMLTAAAAVLAGTVLAVFLTQHPTGGKRKIRSLHR